MAISAPQCVKIDAVGSLKRVTVLEVFSKLVIISKEQDKTLSLFSLSAKKQKNVKTISTCTESTYSIYCHKPAKKYSSRDTITLTAS